VSGGATTNRSRFPRSSCGSRSPCTDGGTSAPRESPIFIRLRVHVRHPRTWKRPPPRSRSPRHDGRRHRIREPIDRNVAMVASTSLSARPHAVDGVTLDGRRVRRHVARPRRLAPAAGERVLPALDARGAGASGGCGSGPPRRLAAQEAAPVKNVAYDSAPPLAICAATSPPGAGRRWLRRAPHRRIGAVGERPAPRDLIGSRAVEARPQHEIPRAPRGIADARREVVRPIASFFTPAAAATRCVERACGPATMSTSTGRRRDAGLLQRLGQRRLTERDIHVLAEALFPLARERVAGHAPAIEKFRALRGRARGLGDDRPLTEHERRGRVAPSRSSPPPARPVRTSKDHGHAGPRASSAARRDRPRAHRAEHVVRGADAGRSSAGGSPSHSSCRGMRDRLSRSRRPPV